jgi:hypothetical protein
MTATIVPIDKINAGAPPPELDFASTAPGKVALWTKADSVTRFDEIEINTLP